MLFANLLNNPKYVVITQLRCRCGNMYNLGRVVIMRFVLHKELCTGKFDCARNILYVLLSLPCVYSKYMDE